MSENTTQTMTATFVKDVSDRFAGTAYLYRVEPPVTGGWDGDTEYDYVVSSGVNALFSGPETYLFPADEDGEVLDWGELDGSFRGAIDPERAVRNAGYELN